MNMLEGGCPCGEVTGRLEGVAEDATACNCTLRRFDGLNTFDDLPADDRCAGDHRFQASTEPGGQQQPAP